MQPEYGSVQFELIVLFRECH